MTKLPIPVIHPRLLIPSTAQFHQDILSDGYRAMQFEHSRHPCIYTPVPVRALPPTVCTGITRCYTFSGLLDVETMPSQAVIHNERIPQHLRSWWVVGDTARKKQIYGSNDAYYVKFRIICSNEHNIIGEISDGGYRARSCVVIIPRKHYCR